MGPVDAVPFAGREAWRAWLDEHHATATEIWIRFAKKGAGVPSVTHAEALEVALCYGWIDAKTHRIDDAWYAHRFVPRAARSTWSKINRAKAEDLIQRGEMQPAGLSEVERARADGRWDAAYDSSRTIVVPDDLQAVLEAEPDTRAFFESLDSQNRYAILWRLQTAGRPETRARRLEQFLTMLRERRKLY